MDIRLVELRDAAGLVPLLAQLDYPSDEGAIRRRIERLLPDRHINCWVAEHNDRLVGVLTGHLSWHIELDQPAARLTALVVDETTRGQGVARQLIAVFEEWARGEGALKASLTSSDYRQDAHLAYEKLGWTVTGKRFAKSLG